MHCLTNSYQNFILIKSEPKQKSQNTLKEYKNMSKRYSIADQTKEGLFNEALSLLKMGLNNTRAYTTYDTEESNRIAKLMYDKLESLPYNLRWIIEGGMINSEKKQPNDEFNEFSKYVKLAPENLIEMEILEFIYDASHKILDKLSNPNLPWK